MEKILNFTKKYWFSILILLISALGVYLRIHVYLFNRSLWMDEAGLANNLLLPHSILDNMTYKQASPPLFKLISLINIKLFGETEYIFIFRVAIQVGRLQMEESTKAAPSSCRQRGGFQK